MSLMERLDDLAKESQTKGCKLIRVLNEDAIPEDARIKFLALLDIPHTDPARVHSTTLARLLRSEGYSIGDKAVERHRNRNCTCYLYGGSQS